MVRMQRPIRVREPHFFSILVVFVLCKYRWRNIVHSMEMVNDTIPKEMKIMT